jgi:bifunctional N-acetylglucosamine-1-phosphate-uridyltransferase/glucosamine-1-phosphate-acetyltransferase GlmU-like protein
MQKHDLVIIAAGSQKRFDSPYLKVLHPFKDSSVLGWNIKKAKPYVNNIYLVLNETITISKCDLKIKYGISEVIFIKSGDGCGKAVLDALNKIPETNNVIVQWGDCIVLDKIVYASTMRVEQTDKIIIPVQMRTNPYVQLFENDVKYSKYGDKTNKEGLQDISTFYGKRSLIIKELEKLSRSRHYYKNYYGDFPESEMRFLDIVKLANNKVKLVDYSFMTQLVYGFNTVDQLLRIEELDI